MRPAWPSALQAGLRYSAAALAGVLVVGSAAGASVSAPAAAAPTGSGGSAESGLDGGHPLFLSAPPAPMPASFSTTVAGVGGGLPSTDRAFGIPATVLDAYRHSADLVSRTQPSCHLAWQILAGIGKVESGHADSGYVDRNGRALRPILGPALDGSSGFAAIPNSAGSRWDQSGPWARAVGPMQFLPSSWARWGADGNGDGLADPENMYDAALAAGQYLCAAGRDLATPNGLRAAILSYNHSEQYLAIVTQWINAYGHGVFVLPDSLIPGTDTTMRGADSETGTNQPKPQPAQPPAAPPPSTRPAPPPKHGPSGPPSPPPKPSPAPPPAGLLPGPLGGLLPPLLGNGPTASSPPPPSSSPTAAPPLCGVLPILGCRPAG